MDAKGNIEKWNERWLEYFDDNSGSIHGYGTYDKIDRIRGRTLDLGCGDFQCANSLEADDDTFLVGIDISDVALNDAKQYLSKTNVDLYKGTAARLPFKDGSFDTVLMSEVMMYTGHEYGNVLSETNRVMIKGGRLAMSTWHKDFYTAQCGMDGVKIINDGNVHTMEDGYMLFNVLALFDENDLTSVLENNGFGISKISVHTSGDIFTTGIYNTYPYGLPPRDTKAVIYIEAEKL